MFNSAIAATVPIQASEIAIRWDALYWFLVWLSVFFFVAIVGAMIYYAVKYRYWLGQKTKYITGSHALEAVWIGVPTVLLMIIFFWGYFLYRDMIHAPADAYEIRVIGKQWLWQFQYDTGVTTVGELYVPMNKPIKLIMTSDDVLHSFFIPNMRVKQDLVPGMYTSVWFEATVPGQHQVYCAEYCGTSHSGMLAKLIVLTDAEWKTWQSGKKLGVIPDARQNVAGYSDQIQTTSAASQPAVQTLTLFDQGKQVFASKGCVACHSVDGSQGVGPTQKGLYGSKVAMADGSTVTVDENYLRESIEKPNAKIVKGYSPVMPTFQGLVSETEMNALIAYIKGVR